MDKTENKFKQYLDSIAETRHSFAKKSGIPIATICGIYAGRKPYRSTAVKVCRHCKGMVTLEDFGYKTKPKKGRSNAAEEGFE